MIIGRLFSEKVFWQRNSEKVSKYMLLMARDNFRKDCATGQQVSEGLKRPKARKEERNNEGVVGRERTKGERKRRTKGIREARKGP